MKEKIKLIAIDFDGTFLDDTHFKTDLSYVNKMFEYSKEIVFASGRGTAGILTLIEKLGIKDNVRYIIGHNGAEIYDVKEKKIIFQAIIDDEIVFGIINEVLNAGYINNPIAIHDWEKLYVYNYDKRVDLENEVNFTINYDIQDIEQFTKNKLKIMFFASGKEVDGIYNTIKNSKYGFMISQTRNIGLLVEVTDKNINKATALEFLANKLNVSMSEILAFGNGENDIQMINGVAYGYAMKNADESLKKIAQYITKYDNNECGVEREIIDIFGV